MSGASGPSSTLKQLSNNFWHLSSTTRSSSTDAHGPPEDARAHQFYAFTLERLGRRKEAKVEMQKGIEINPNDLIIIYNAACFYALIGDKKEAIEILKKAIDNGFENFEYIKHDPDLYRLQEEPDFIALLQGK